VTVKNRQTGRSFLPDFCSIRMVFAVVITAELLAIVLTVGTADSVDAFAIELSLRSLFIQWVALPGCALLCLCRRWLERLDNTLVGLIAWCLLMLVTLMVSLLGGALLEIDKGGFLLLQSLVISGIVSALVLRYLYIQYLWRQQVEAESKARFQALQSRIRPHFLFNSMNTIASLTRTDAALAEEVVYDLSDLFRASLSNAQRSSTLGDELALCRGYLRIEEQRLGARLQVVWDLKGLPEAAKLPPLILQPLLENAVYHGIEPAVQPGTIQISGRYRRKQVNISVRNTGPESAGEGLRQGNRMALDNIRQRLQGFFAGEATLRVGAVDGEYQVRVAFPHPWDEA
jgi:two-component system sensor histidine kinase AlgZ